MIHKSLLLVPISLIGLTLVSCGDPVDCCAEDPHSIYNTIQVPANLPQMNTALSQAELQANYRAEVSNTQVAEDLKLIAYYGQDDEQEDETQTALAKSNVVSIAACIDSVTVEMDTLENGEIETRTFEYFNSQGQLQGFCASGNTMSEYMLDANKKMDGFAMRVHSFMSNDTSTMEGGSYTSIQNQVQNEILISSTYFTKSLLNVRYQGARGTFNSGLILDFTRVVDPNVSAADSNYTLSVSGTFQYFFVDGRYLCAGDYSNLMNDVEFSCNLTHQSKKVGTIWFKQNPRRLEIYDRTNQLVLP